MALQIGETAPDFGADSTEAAKPYIRVVPQPR